MITITDSNIFNTDAEAIVNTINCVGFMGKGLALEYSLRYPELLIDYKNRCKNKEIKIGKMYYFKTNDKLIVNFPTKDDYKYPSKIEWIEEGLKDFVKTYKTYKISSIAFPLLGCSNGQLNYNQVVDMIKKYLSNLDINVYICLDKKNPEGKELEMINAFKKCNIDALDSYVNLNSKQKDNLKCIQKSIIRFNQISKIDGIGFITYKKIYDIFYNNKYNNNQNLNQLSLF